MYLISNNILINVICILSYKKSGLTMQQSVCSLKGISISMVISYVYAKNSAPRADRGFLNDVQNTNSNCDITM